MIARELGRKSLAETYLQRALELRPALSILQLMETKKLLARWARSQSAGAAMLERFWESLS